MPPGTRRRPVEAAVFFPRADRIHPAGPTLTLDTVELSAHNRGQPGLVLGGSQFSICDRIRHPVAGVGQPTCDDTRDRPVRGAQRQLPMSGFCGKLGHAPTPAPGGAALQEVTALAWWAEWLVKRPASGGRDCLEGNPYFPPSGLTDQTGQIWYVYRIAIVASCHLRAKGPKGEGPRAGNHEPKHPICRN